jgi:LysR family transcriptional activator of dmlA
VTDDGERVYRSAREIFEEAERLGEAVTGGRFDPRGALRMNTSFRLGPGAHPSCP